MESEKVERKIYSVIKSIPFVGHAYSAIRMGVYAARGNEGESRFSASEFYSLDNLNPVRAVTNLIRHTTSVNADYQRGIWIGKRGLASGLLPKFSFSPGVDFAHWAILINGTCYQLGGSKFGAIFCDWTSSDNEIATFEWYLLSRDDSLKSTQELVERGNLLCKDGYTLIPIFFKFKSINFQVLVTDLYAFAANIDGDTAEKNILVAVGTSLF